MLCSKAEQTDVLLMNTQFVVGLLIEPIAVCYLAAYLRDNGHKVTIYDPSSLPGSLERHLENLLDYQPRFLGISVLAGEYQEQVFWLVQQLRDRGYEGHICVGGQDVSLEWQNYLTKCRGIDFAVIGEGEETLLELLEALKTGKTLSGVQGLVFRGDNGELIRNPPRRLRKNLDELPFMARDVLKTHIEVLEDRTTASIFTTRGCSHRCRFCAAMAYYASQPGRAFRCRSIDNILEEMCQLNKRYGIHSFAFDDDNFMLPGRRGLKRVERFCEGIKRLPFSPTFTISIRVDGVSYEPIKLLRDAGLRHIYMGIESFISKDLRWFGKGVDSQQVIEAMDVILAAGFSTVPGSKLRLRVGTIVFNPFTTLEDLEIQSRLFRRYQIPPKKLATKLIAYPHTAIHRELDEKGLLNADNSFRFTDPQVALVYGCYKGFLDQALQIRDRIRSVQKAALVNLLPSNLNLHELPGLIDNKCYTVFTELLKVAREDSSELPAYRDQAITEFQAEYGNGDLLSKVIEMEQQFDKSGIGHRMR